METFYRKQKKEGKILLFLENIYTQVSMLDSQITCIIPMQGKTQVELAGRTSLSAQHMNSKTWQKKKIKTNIKSI